MIEQTGILENPEKEYKTKVLFLRKSKAGAHLYAFNRDRMLGGDVGSLIMDISEVERVIAGSTDWIKIGVIPANKEKEEQKDGKDGAGRY